MSKIAKLIAKHCPDGVEFQKLAELCVSLKKDTLKTGELSESGKYPVINSGREWYGYYDECNNDGNALAIAARGEYAGFITYIDQKFWAGGLCYPYRSKDESVVSTKYIYHALKKREQFIMATLVARGSIPALNKSDIDAFKIPVPPLEIQREIVKILDSFTALEAELEAELEARRRQYSYYRDALLAFDDDAISAASKQASKQASVRWASLESISMKTNNIRWREAGDANLAYIDLSSVNRDNNEITETQTINAKTAPSRAQQIVQEDDVIFGTTRPTLKRFCRIPKKYDGQICSTGFCVLRADKKQVLPKYLYFSITTTAFNNYVERNQEGAGYPAISDAKVKSFKIPVPPMEEQERIVSILDKFDALVNDLSSGLPAEIAARRQQYEHYRDRLLTFHEAA